LGYCVFGSNPISQLRFMESAISVVGNALFKTLYGVLICVIRHKFLDTLSRFKNHFQLDRSAERKTATQGSGLFRRHLVVAPKRVSECRVIATSRQLAWLLKRVKAGNRRARVRRNS